MADSSDDEPDWLVEQASARKSETRDRLALSDSDVSAVGSPSDDEKPSKAKNGKAKATADGQATDSKVTSGPKGKGRAPPSSRLPLLFAPKVRRDILLVEADDPNLDLSGDFGCIGKLHVRKSSSGGAGSSAGGGDADGSVAELRQTLMLDLKGKVYDADILPCNSLCLLTVDAAKAKV